MIESDLEDQGIKARCNYARSSLEVELDEAKFSEDQVLRIVKDSGYVLSSAAAS